MEYEREGSRPRGRPKRTWRDTHTLPFYGSVDFVRDNPGEPVPEETFTHSHLGLAERLCKKTVKHIT